VAKKIREHMVEVRLVERKTMNLQLEEKREIKKLER
jgi:hypothetical protein